MKQKQARRQRIPAFGEWNYSYGGDWPVTQYSDSAVPPSLAPLPVKKAAKWRGDSATMDDAEQHMVMVVGLGDHGEVKKQSRVADYKAVDQDLYEIPPHMLCHKPRKKLTTGSVWLGCLGLSCVDA